MSESASASADKYADYSREQLLAEINRLKKNKKYGLVWEHKKEQVIEDFETQQPYLQEVTEKRIENAPGEPTNLIIEGDNFEALSILNYTHAGKVDVIYIDPPYNTGNKDFIYNDNYVDSEDEFRHSKWLSFMEPRLKLAKNLLKDDGVIFISIDDNELSSLRILCDKIFCGYFINNLIWTYGKMSNESKKFANNHEYILCYGKSERSILVPSMKKEDTEYKKRWEKYLRNNKIYYGDVKNKSDKMISKRIKKALEDEKLGVLPDDYVLYDFDKEYKVDNDVLYCPIIKGNSSEKISEFGAGQKPLDLLYRVISSFPRKDITVLDFFAGTGTTCECCVRLSKMDGGQRECIICTNNENNIAEDITYGRLKRLDGDISINLRYFKIKHCEKKASIDANRLEIVRYLEDIIQVKENAFEQIEVNEDLALYKNSERFVGMVFEPFALEEIIESIKEKNSENKPVKLYVFSYSRDAFEDNYGTDFEIEFVAMPEGLLKTYANIVAETKKEDA